MYPITKIHPLAQSYLVLKKPEMTNVRKSLIVKLYVDRNAPLHCCKSNKLEVKIKMQRSILTHFKGFLMLCVDFFDKKQGINCHPWKLQR